ncbi:MAG: hypothetical protein RR365_06420 [Bacteroides sp.]
MENVKKLTEALSLLQSIPCTGKENMTRMLIAMQRITEVATDLAENGDGKE